MSEKKPDKGMVQVYTGDGKGKTTAALGLSLRAVGHGLRVHIVQFLKNPDMMDEPYGEIKAARDLMPGIVIHSFGLPRWVKKDDVRPEDIAEARKAMDYARGLLTDPAVNVIILDEVFMALHLGMIPMEEILNFIDSKPTEKELILTGRNAPEEIVEKADLVTEMRVVKHYFEKGVMARKGIEY